MTEAVLTAIQEPLGVADVPCSKPENFRECSHSHEQCTIDAQLLEAAKTVHKQMM